MNALYSENDLSILQQQLRRRRVAVLIPAILLAAAVVVSFIYRIEWLTILLVLLCGVVLIFGFDFCIRPLRSYAAHIRAALYGPHHEVDCTYLSTSPDLSVIEYVSYRTVSVMGFEDKHGDPIECQYYWDAEKALPDLQEGAPLRISYHDRAIIAWSAL